MIKYVVKLTGEEVDTLESVLKQKICSKEKRLRSYILLKSDHKIGWSDKKIAESYGVSVSCIERVRQRLIEQGFDAALNRKIRSAPPRPRKIQGKEEAHLLAMCCSEAPEGRARWTLKLLANKMVELKIVESISGECVRRALKKTNLSHG